MIDDRDDCADQALVPTEVCLRPECQTWGWRDDVPVRPILKLNHRGFWVCPKCRASYGAHAKQSS